MTKRILSLVLTFAMVLVRFQTMPLTAFGAEDDTFIAKITVGGSQVNCTFKILSEPSGETNGTVQIGDGINGASSNNYEGELTLPSTVINGTNTYDVTTIGDNAFFGFYNLTGRLTIPDSVTAIGDFAFYDCPGFNGNLTIPEGVITIGYSAFGKCSGFTGDLTISGSVTSIGAYAFNDCSGFTGNLTISEGLTTTTIGNYAFNGCSGFTGSLIIPDSVTTIGNNAFNGCSGFTGSLTIRDSVTTIGDYAFYGCSGFTGSLTISEGVTTIGDYAFYDCSGFTGSLAIPDKVTTIGERAFYNCSGFDGSLIISDSVTTIGELAFFYCSGFTGSLTIPERLETIDNGVFYCCSGFTGSLTIPDSVTTIGEYAFLDCSGFTGDLIIPDKVTTIGNNAFNGCSGFTGDLTIPGVTTIGNNAFFDCSGFTSLTLSEGITTISDGAFIGCSGFTGSLIIPESVTTIGEYAFYGCSGFTGSLIIPESVTTIEEYAFYGCSGFTGSLIIPGKVTIIDEHAFNGCSGLNGNLIIPDSVYLIGEGAFLDCLNIKNIIFAGTALPFSMGSYAFLSAISISAVYVSETWQGGDWLSLPGLDTSFTRDDNTLKTIYNLTADKVTIADAIYNGSEQQPTVIVTANGTTVPSSEYTLSNWTDNTDAGTNSASVTVTANAGSLYIVGSVIKTFTIEKSDTTFDGDVKTYNGTTQTSTFTYGDVITVKFRPEMAAQTFSLSEPTSNQAALFLGDTQISAPVNVTMGTECVLTYDTTDKLLAATGVSQTLTVEYVGTDNLNKSQGSVSITLNKKALTGGTITAGQSKVYDGTDIFSGIAVDFNTANGALSGDAVTATASGTVTDKNVGTNKALTVTSAILGGADKGYYSLPISLATITGYVEITKASGLTATTPDNIPMVKNLEKAYTYDLSKISFNHNDTGTKTFILGTLMNSEYFKTVPSLNGHTLSFESNAIAIEGIAVASQTVMISSQNYNDTAVTLSFDITDKMPVTISGVSVSGVAADGTIVYSGQTMSYTGTPSFSETGYNGADLVYEWHDASGVLAAPPKNVGSYSLEIYIPASNIMYIGSETIPFEIIKKGLTVTVDNKTIGKGDAKPAYTATTGGLATGQTITGISFTDNASDTNTAGTFTITPSGGTISGGNANYNITYVNGTLTVKPKFNVTVTNGTGGGSYAAGATVTISADNKSNYTFTNWTASGVTLSNPNSSTTTFVMPNGNVSVTANYSYNDSGNNGGGDNSGDNDGNTGGNTNSGNNSGNTGGTASPTEPVIKAETNTADKTTTAKATVTVTSTAPGASAKASVSNDLVNKLIEKSIEAAEKAKTTPQVEINVDAPSNTESVELTLPKTGVASIAKGKTNGLCISTPFATITFNSKALEVIANVASGDINVTVSVVDKKTLPEATQLIVGNKPVYDFTVTSGSKVITGLGNGKAVITFPYTLANGEKANNIVIYYINDRGNLEVVKNCNYDEKTKTVSFATTHFSKYTVGVKSASYPDVSQEWYTNAVEFVTIRGLFNGYNGNFNPNGTMTKAMFVQVLANLEGITPTTYTVSEYADVDGNAWYTGAIMWAASNKLIGAKDGLIEPEVAIRREEMAVILYNYIMYKGIDLNVVNDKPFSDINDVSAENKTAVEFMKKYGLIEGMGDNTYAPKQSASRAEVAAIFTNVIKVMSK